MEVKVVFSFFLIGKEISMEIKKSIAEKSNNLLTYILCSWNIFFKVLLL